MSCLRRDSWSWLFLRSRRSNPGDEPILASPAAGEVLAGLSEAQSRIGSASHDIGVVVVLSVIFPETDRADVEAASLVESLAATTGTAQRQASRLSRDTLYVQKKPTCSGFDSLLRGFHDSYAACRVLAISCRDLDMRSPRITPGMFPGRQTPFAAFPGPWRTRVLRSPRRRTPNPSPGRRAPWPAP